jgi:hypothetical protein
MDLSQYVNQLREDLASAAAAGDEQTRRTAALLGAAIEPAARLAVMNALSDLAAEVTAALPDRVVEVRLDGRDVRVSVSGDSAATDHADAPQEPQANPFSGFAGLGGLGGLGGDGGGDISRITLRLVEQIKNQAEQAAADQGVSLNSWVSQAVQGALSGAMRAKQGGGAPRRDKQAERDKRRIQGWVQG